MHEEFRLQNLEPVEFGKQISGGVGSGRKRVLGMHLRIIREGLVRGGELQVIHLHVAQIESHGRASQISREP